MFEYYRVFAKQIKPLPPEPFFQIFIILRRLQKMVKYYYQIMVSKASTLAGSYTTSKGNKSSSLRRDKTQ